MESSAVNRIPTSLSRRLILRLAGEVGITLGIGPVGSAFAQDAGGGGEALTAAVRATLESYLETLIPSDDLGPGAAQSGVVAAFEDAASASPNFGHWVTGASGWLDAQAAETGARSFASLDEDARDTIVAKAAGSPVGSPPRQFFEGTRRAAFAVHYANPATWRSLGFDGPPQPVGFPDYADPPASRP